MLLPMEMMETCCVGVLAMELNRACVFVCVCPGGYAGEWVLRVVWGLVGSVEVCARATYKEEPFGEETLVWG